MRPAVHMVSSRKAFGGLLASLSSVVARSDEAVKSGEQPVLSTLRHQVLSSSRIQMRGWVKQPLF